MKTRMCGDCQLCCKLLPMDSQSNAKLIPGAANMMIEMGLIKPGMIKNMLPDFDKPAGKPCKHQRHGKGCAVYKDRPFGCRFWSCKWLVMEPGTEEMRRPDRTRYVIDIMPDFIEIQKDEAGPTLKIEVVQVWCDPAKRDAWRDPLLLAYLDACGKKGIAALIRYDNMNATAVFPPSMSSDDQWHEIDHGSIGPQHSGDDLFRGLAEAARVKAG